MGIEEQIILGYLNFCGESWAMLTFSDSPVEWLSMGNELNVVSWQLRDF